MQGVINTYLAVSRTDPVAAGKFYFTYEREYCERRLKRWFLPRKEREYLTWQLKMAKDFLKIQEECDVLLKSLNG